MGATASDLGPSFDPFEPGYLDHPYDQFERLRAAGEVRAGLLGGYQLLGYEDCFRLLREPGTSVDAANANDGGFGADQMTAYAEEHGIEEVGSRSILVIDPPDHTRLRKLVARVFTPRAIEGLRPAVAAIADELLAPYGPGDTIDLIDDLAFPLPFQVISHMLGMPDDGDIASLRDWSHTLAGTLDPILDPDHVARAFEASQSMRAHLADVVAWKREHPGDDLLTGLIGHADDGDVLSDRELIDQLVLLFIAGHETTVNLIGNGTYALLTHPDQRQRLVEDPSLVANAVEECLRFDPPVQMTRRVTMAPFQAGDVEIGAGEFVLALTAAANRDPRRWGPDAAEFDIGRDGANHHLSFGSGIHHCLGAALARMEGQVTIGTMADRYPNLALAGEPVRNGRIVLRGLDHLPVTLG